MSTTSVRIYEVDPSDTTSGYRLVNHRGRKEDLSGQFKSSVFHQPLGIPGEDKHYRQRVQTQMRKDACGYDEVEDMKAKQAVERAARMASRSAASKDISTLSTYAVAAATSASTPGGGGHIHLHGHGHHHHGHHKHGRGDTPRMLFAKFGVSAHDETGISHSTYHQTCHESAGGSFSATGALNAFLERKPKSYRRGCNFIGHRSPSGADLRRERSHHSISDYHIPY